MGAGCMHFYMYRSPLALKSAHTEKVCFGLLKQCLSPALLLVALARLVEVAQRNRRSVRVAFLKLLSGKCAGQSQQGDGMGMAHRMG